MPYNRKAREKGTFLGTLVPKGLFCEFTRLCKLSGRSKAKEIERAVSIRVAQLQKQERQGTISGIL